MAVSSEVKLVSAAAGLYSSFLYWGYLQEKITGADYVSPVDASVTGRWHYSFVLNGGWWFSLSSRVRTSYCTSLQQRVSISQAALIYVWGRLPPHS